MTELTQRIHIGHPPTAEWTRVELAALLHAHHGRHGRPAWWQRLGSAVHRPSWRTVRPALLIVGALELSGASGWMTALGITGTGLVLAANGLLLVLAAGGLK